MDHNTKAELLDAGGSAIVSVMKELFVRQQEMDRMERQAEMQKEIELARAGVDADREARRASGSSLQAPSGRDGVVQTLGRAEELADEYEDLLRQAEEMESCQLCKKLIRGARNRPVSQQQELLPALSEFFQSVEDDTPTEEVAAQVRQDETLLSLIQETMAGG